MLTIQDAYSAGFTAGLKKFANAQNLLHLATSKAQAKNPIGLRDPKTYMTQGPTSTQMPMATAKKTGAIFGADVPSAVEHAAIPYDQRRQMYEDYAREKSQEPPTGYGKAMGWGGALGGLGGAGLGALLGHASGNTGMGAMMGAGGGGALGAAVGGLAAHGDKSNIEQAQHVMSNDDNLDPALAQQIQDMIEARESQQRGQRGMDNWQARSRHSDVMDALRNRGGNI